MSSAVFTTEKINLIRDALSSCTMCGFCKSVCPSFKAINWDTDLSRGRIVMTYGLATGQLKADPSVVQSMYTCTTCADCGGPLVPSKEEWLKEKAARDAEKKGEEDAALAEEIAALEESGETPAEACGEAGRNCLPEHTYVYETARARADDVKSSRNAFALIGVLAAAAAALSGAGVIPLPMAGNSRIFFLLVLAAIGAAMLAVAVKSQLALKQLNAKADAEEKETAEVLDWFRSTYPAEDLDNRLLQEDPDLEEGELFLRRNQLIADLLATGRDLPDQRYVDYLADLIMNEYYA